MIVLTDGNNKLENSKLSVQSAVLFNMAALLAILEMTREIIKCTQSLGKQRSSQIIDKEKSNKANFTSPL